MKSSKFLVILAALSAVPALAQDLTLEDNQRNPTVEDCIGEDTVEDLDKILDLVSDSAGIFARMRQYGFEYNNEEQPLSLHDLRARWNEEKSSDEQRFINRNFLRLRELSRNAVERHNRKLHDLGNQDPLAQVAIPDETYKPGKYTIEKMRELVLNSAKLDAAVEAAKIVFAVRADAAAQALAMKGLINALVVIFPELAPVAVLEDFNFLGNAVAAAKAKWIIMVSEWKLKGLVQDASVLLIRDVMRHHHDVTRAIREKQVEKE